MRTPLKYNLVDAYERELNDWWFEIPPIVDRFYNVASPVIHSYVDTADMLENGLEYYLSLEIE